jgi:hypothetical protein
MQVRRGQADAGLVSVVRSHRGVRAIPTLLVLVSACGADPGAQVAERIQNVDSPLVVSVEYRSANVLDDPVVIVILREGTTETEAEAFWCNVVVPAGGTADGGPSTVSLYSFDGAEALAVDVACPGR